MVASSRTRKYTASNDMEVDEGEDEEEMAEAEADLGDTRVGDVAGARVTGKEESVRQRRAIIMIISILPKITISSILMQNRNQRCNWLQSLVGIFLHATNAPQKVVDTLHRMGLSVSVRTVHNSLRSLGQHALEEAGEVAHTLAAAYAYDNFDIDFKKSVPTVETAGVSLQHFTSSLIFPLLHSTADDLRCSDYLWKRSVLNSQALPDMLSPKVSWQQLAMIHADTRI
ncbi:hypothetical protein BDW22DRAFT_1446960 [Trametopsis cervina]|nr:hypothetical protein BDW22DRAFT_1446960 [Trametopsis cervina]